MMKKNTLISLFFVLILLLGAYFFWCNTWRQKPASAPYEEVMNTSQNQSGNSATQNNQAAMRTAINQVPSQKPDSSVLKKSNIIPANRLNYTNKRLGFTFQYPATWVKNGGDAEVINLSGVKTETDISFTDTALKSSLLIAYHFAPEGAKLYDYVSNQYHASKGRFAIGGTQIHIAGKIAFESSAILSLDGRGKKLNPPLRSVIVDFQDYEQTGTIEFQFKTPATNEEAEVNRFNQLLSGFKFMAKY
jgi:hypothetical protein